MEERDRSLLRHSEAPRGGPAGGALTEPTPELRELLRAYARVLALVPELPFALWLRRRNTPLGRHVRVLRLRWLVGFFLVAHVQRTTAALRRRCHAASVLGEDEEQRLADLRIIDAFERSLPARSSPRLLSVVLGLAVFLCAFLMANYTFRELNVPGIPRACSKDELAQDPHCRKKDSFASVTAQPLGRMTTAIVTLDRRQLVTAVETFGCATVEADGRGKDCSAARTGVNAATAIVLLPALLWLLLLVPLTSLRLKRLLLFTRAESVYALRAEFAAEPKPAPTTIAELEVRAFAALGARRPAEQSLDLFAQATLMVPLLAAAALTVVLAVAVVVVTIDDYRHGYVEASDDLIAVVVFFAAAALTLLLPVGRLVSLQRTARRRYACAATPAPACGARWPRRAGAQLVDLIAIGTVAAGLAVAVAKSVHPEDARVALYWVGVGPVAVLIYTLLAVLGPGRGQTLGKRSFGLQVVRDDRAAPTLRRILVREVVVKCLLFGPLIVPLLLDVLWPLCDHRRRAWHDIVTGTVVVRRQPEPAAVADAEPAMMLVY